MADPERRDGGGKAQRDVGQHSTVEGKSALNLLVEAGDQNVEPKSGRLCRDGSCKVRLRLDKHLVEGDRHLWAPRVRDPLCSERARALALEHAGQRRNSGLPDVALEPQRVEGATQETGEALRRGDLLLEVAPQRLSGLPHLGLVPAGHAEHAIPAALLPRQVPRLRAHGRGDAAPRASAGVPQVRARGGARVPQLSSSGKPERRRGRGRRHECAPRVMQREQAETCAGPRLPARRSHFQGTQRKLGARTAQLSFPGFRHPGRTDMDPGSRKR